MITIGIPSYNQSQYLKEAIESALAQTVPCEVIVCDDGSTDNSLKIAQSYGKIRVISQVNKGLASARNTIIMNMTGDYLLPLDADDTFLPNAIEKIQQKIDETNADIVAPSFRCFGKFNQDIIIRPANVFDFLEANRIGYFSAIRKSKLLEIGGYNPKMVFGWEDLDLWIDLLKGGAKLVTMEDILVMYRTKENSMYTDSLKHSEFLQKQLRLNHPELYV